MIHAEIVKVCLFEPILKYFDKNMQKVDTLIWYWNWPQHNKKYARECDHQSCFSQISTRLDDIVKHVWKQRNFQMALVKIPFFLMKQQCNESQMIILNFYTSKTIRISLSDITQWSISDEQTQIIELFSLAEWFRHVKASRNQSDNARQVWNVKISDTHDKAHDQKFRTVLNIYGVLTNKTVRLILKVICSSRIMNSWNIAAWMKALAITHLASSTVTFSPFSLAKTIAVC